MSRPSNGVPITIDGYQLVYLASGTRLDAVRPDHPVDQATDDLLLRHPRIRGAIHSSLNRPMLLLLRWPEGTDLSALDERVRTGTQTASDFDQCVSAYVGRQRCRVCGGTTRAVLPDAGSPPSSPERWRRNPVHRLCPLCGAESLAYLDLMA